MVARGWEGYTCNVPGPKKRMTRVAQWIRRVPPKDETLGSIPSVGVF